ncbi:MAG: homoserine dehydrogenase [Verrucomicrobia bacterium]|nr:homoserine dehydrogenase [Verrucomicrobiota bacterium]MDE3099101.1 homoserine dehydrogenase [Verrucomicrobiota bacterium]
MQQVNAGIIGLGTVGSGVFNALQLNGGLLSSRIGIRVAVKKIAVRSLAACASKISRTLLVEDWRSVVDDPDIHIVAELVGGATVARDIVLAALKRGKSVVTANKALISAHGEELFAAASRHGANFYYEASVCGGIPIIKSLREGFVGNRIVALYGIVNGTCNYILTRMKLERAAFADVLADAQRLGYAETPPDLDIDGHDAAHKIGILASLAHGFWVNPKSIYMEGIRDITALDIQFAEKLGYTIKLLAIVKKTAGPATKQSPRARGSDCPRGIQVSVYPTAIPSSHVLASVNDAFNAVFVRGDIVGDSLFYGRGAGKSPTASAVLSDLADAALDLKFGNKHRVPPFVPHECAGAVLPMEQIVSAYFVRLNVVDRPGTLAKIAAIFGGLNIGISSVIQPEGHEGRSVPLIFMLHYAANGAVMAALKKISRLPVVKGRPMMIRVENFE